MIFLGSLPQLTSTQYIIAAGVCCTWGLATIKLFFVARYSRIFTQPWSRRANKILAIILIATGGEERLIFIFRDQPIEKACTPASSGYCVNLKAFCYASLAIKLPSDTVHFLQQPLKSIWGLRCSGAELN
ncbi:unnamed protein product [Discula destructiva]